MRILSEDLVNRLLSDTPLAGSGIVCDVGETVPVGLVHLRIVGTEVISGPAGLFTEHDCANVCFRLPGPVDIFPAAHELVQVLGAQLLSVFFQEDEQLKSTFDTTRYIEIAFEQPAGAELLSGPGITRVEPWGDKWRVYSDDPDRAVKHLASVAEREHLTVVSIATSSPTLEEAFVKLTGGV